MSRFLRPLAVLLFAATAVSAAPRPPFIPMCYDLPTCTFSSGTWTLSHPCRQGTSTVYVYVNQAGAWCLYGPIMP